MAHIHWYPGHIAKAEKKLQQQLSLVDVVVEVLDARIPLSSMYPNIETLIKNTPRLVLLNKSDLVEGFLLKDWVEYLKNYTESPVVTTSLGNAKDITQILSAVEKLAKPKIDKLVEKGLLPRAARVMVVGMPNVGKSSVINKLIKKAKTKTGAKAGVTRQQQWVRINPKIDLLDTPGIIPLKQEDQEVATKLAFVNSIGENAYNHEEVARDLVKLLSEKYPKNLLSYYNLPEDTDFTLESIALARNWIVKNQEPDINRCAYFVLADFRNGKIGKMILDDLPSEE